jgi:transcriptional regulator with XRE-family HTH domain
MPKKLPPMKKPSRDPIIEEVMEAMADNKVSITQIANKSGIAKATLYKWRNGQTSRPQHITVKFALNVMRLDLGIVPLRNR